MTGSRSASGHSSWQRGVPGRLERAVLLRAVAAVAVIGAVIALAPVVRDHLAGTPLALAGPAGAAADDPWPAETPAERTDLAFLSLDEPLDRAVSALGPPDERVPDINAAWTSTWDLGHGSELRVTADEQGITGLAARVPNDPAVQIEAHAGIVLGESTPADITQRWGDDHEIGRHTGEDFVLRYIECAGPFPVVVKFDQRAADAEVRWDEPVTSVFIAYADAEPGTAGCPALSASA